MDTRSADDCFRPKEANQWESVVAAAYRTVGRDDSVTAAYVVLPRRPTYQEMSRFRAHERPGAIRMSLAWRDCVCIRTHPAEATAASAREAHGIAPGAHRMESTRRRYPHQRGWMQQLLTMTEGVR